MSDRKVLICSAWPYAYDMMHLGNLVGCLLSGDVFERFYRLKGCDVVHVSGSDMHGTRTEFEALKRGVAPETIAKKTHEAIVKVLEGFQVEMENYTTTSTVTHRAFVQQLYSQAQANGYITARDEQRAFCQVDHVFLADSFIEGTCPKCQADGAKGNQCEACGALLEPEELIEPSCTLCGQAQVAFKSTRAWYLDLDKLQPQLQSYIDAHPEWEGNVRHFTRQMLDEGLQPRAVTRDLKWGIPAPFEGAEGKVIYVWAEAALGYVSATQEHFERLGTPERFDDFWRNPEAKHVYTQGKDNIAFHTLFFPGQLLASQQGYHLPDQFSAVEYLQWIGGAKFSKTHNVGIFCDEALELMDPSYWRFYLISVRPERKDVAFSWEDVDNAVNGTLNNNVLNLIYRVVSLAHKRTQGCIPDAEPDPEIVEAVAQTARKVEATVEAGSLAPAVRQIVQLAVLGNAYVQRVQPWKEGQSHTLSGALHLAKALAVLLEPFVPRIAHKARAMFNLDEERLDYEEVARVRRGHELGQAQPLFEKLDIDELKARYDALKAPKRDA